MRPDADGLRVRIQQARRALSTPATPNAPHGDSSTEPAPAADLQTRIGHLEQLVQGLQDSVYRESQRNDKRITELETRLDPATLNAALSQDARERGL
jgi:hypothetical protein